MKSLTTFFAKATGIFVALMLAPFLAFFGLMILGLTFGLSFIAADAMAAMTDQAEGTTPDASTGTDPRSSVQAS